MTQSNLSTFLFVLVAIFLLAGCPSDECTTNADCKSAKICQKGACVSLDPGNDAESTDAGGNDEVGVDVQQFDTGPDMGSACPNDCSDVAVSECEQVACDLATLTCVVSNVADETTCDDGLFCTANDTCQAGVCGGVINDCGMTAEVCQEISCDEASNTCSAVPGPNDVACIGNACDENSACLAGVCVGTPIDCSATPVGVCEVAVCDSADGLCKPTSEIDGLDCDLVDDLCSVGNSCLAGVCQGGAPLDCSMTPTDVCEVPFCDPLDGVCKPINDVNGVACTDPNDLCSVGNTCSSGVCQGGSANDCSGTVVPECQTPVCDPSNGACVPIPENNGTACLGDLCAIGSVCTNGTCGGGTPLDCSALDDICADGVCDPANGQCIAIGVPNGTACDTPNPECQVGLCDSAQNCVYQPANDGIACTDFDSCTDSDTCQTGVCGGSAIPACPVIFEEQFETCALPGWTLASEWECGVPTVGPTTVPTGSQLLGLDLDDNYDINASYNVVYAETPTIVLTEPTALRFDHWVHTEGSILDGYNIKISTDAGLSFQVLSTVTPTYNLTVASQPAFGGQVATWETITADLAAYTGQAIILRFSFRSDGAITYPGVYIDNLILGEPVFVPLNIETSSLGYVTINEPSTFPLSRSGGSANAVWSITNSTNASWLSIDPATGTLSGTPSAGDIGPGSITVRVEEPTYPSNFDEQTITFDVKQIIFFDDVENNCPGLWTLSGIWSCGVPVSGPNAAFSGLNVIATNLTGNYSNDASFLSNTATFSLSLLATTRPVFQFRVWAETEELYDGFNLKVSTDNGATFNIVSTVDPPYTHNLATEDAWSGSAMFWGVRTADLSAYAGQNIMLQFGFRSDGSVSRSGVYIDDVEVLD